MKSYCSKHLYISKVFSTQKQRLKLELSTSYNHGVFQDVYSELFGKKSGQFRGWSGTSDSVESITFDDILNHKQQNFNPNNTTIVITGSFDENEVLNEVSNVSLQKEVNVPQINVSIDNKIVWKKNSNETVEDIDVFIPMGTELDYKSYALDMILQHSLIDTNKALLNTLLYKDLATTHGIGSEILHWSHGSVLAFWFQALPKDIKKTADAIEKLFTNLPTKLTKEIVDTAHKRSIMKFNTMTSQPDLLGRWVGENFLLTGKVMTPEEFNACLHSCTYDEVTTKAENISKMSHLFI